MLMAFRATRKLMLWYLEQLVNMLSIVFRAIRKSMLKVIRAIRKSILKVIRATRKSMPQFQGPILGI